jgi:acyl-CoA synthetase (AMP-forming)/AMP-acid ligase II
VRRRNPPEPQSVDDPGVTDGSAAELDAHLLERIARFKRPKRYEFIDDLPKNSYGKVLIRELRNKLV